ncbi:MAG TPA: hypothetical protein VGM88_22320 [Kofleriaceae bacterium]
MQSIYVPTAIGVAALAELDRVDWDDLAFAYSGLPRESLHNDVAASLRRLADDPETALDALFSNIYHQRTVYEATAYAVPFLAAVAADPAWPRLERMQLAVLLVAIGLSSTFATDDGCFAGAFGEGVDERIREALVASTDRLRAMRDAHPTVAAAIDALCMLAAEPVSDENFQRTRDAISALEAANRELRG